MAKGKKRGYRFKDRTIKVPKGWKLSDIEKLFNKKEHRVSKVRLTYSKPIFRKREPKETRYV